MYGIFAIYEVLHTIRLRGYGKDAIYEVCIQLDCVGMARMPYPKFCIQLDCVGMARMPYPPTKSSCRMFCRSFFLCLYMSFTIFRAPS